MINPFIHRLSEDVPLLATATLARLLGASLTAQDVQLAEHPALSRLRTAVTPRLQIAGDIATVPIHGTLAYSPDAIEMAYFGVEDSRNAVAMVNQAANDPAIKGILLSVNTPGGMMVGGPEIADAVAGANKSKPVVAHIGGLGASLGYMIASQAGEVIANRSALVGSIGVIASVADYSSMLAAAGIKFEYFTNKEAKFKATGAFGTSLNEDQKAYLQSQVDGAFSVFKKAVLSARPQVKPEAMQGQVFRGDESASVGLIDRIGDENFALGVLCSEMRRRSNKN